MRELQTLPILTSINRNIVECKDGSFRRIQDLQERINRNIVECKAL